MLDWSIFCIILGLQYAPKRKKFRNALYQQRGLLVHILNPLQSVQEILLSGIYASIVHLFYGWDQQYKKRLLYLGALKKYLRLLNNRNYTLTKKMCQKEKTCLNKNQHGRDYTKRDDKSKPKLSNMAICITENHKRSNTWVTDTFKVGLAASDRRP